MANYFNTLSLRTKLDQLGRCRFMEREEFAEGCEFLEGKKRIGLTSGASAPEHLVTEVIDTLTKKYGFKLQGNRTRTDEGISFRLPKGLR